MDQTHKLTKINNIEYWVNQADATKYCESMYCLNDYKS